MPDEAAQVDPPQEDAEPRELFDGVVALPGLTKSLASACRLLRHNGLRPRLLRKGYVEFNEMTKLVELDRQPVADVEMALMRERIERYVRGAGSDGKQKTIQFSAETIREAFAVVANEHRYHPVREYLEYHERFSCSPPGVEPDRSINAVADLLGLGDGLPRRILRKWAVGCVARAFEPGRMHKSALILVGNQNAGKSAFFRTLAGEEWFSDTYMDLRRTDAYLQLHGAWIYEWPELASMSSGSMEQIKAFLSSATDSFRSPYGHSVERHPRTTVIVGSTNRLDFLSDSTGNVRFWPLLVRRVIDLEALELYRDSFWAEAVLYYRAGEQTWLEDTRDQQDLAAAQVAYDASGDDAWTEPVELWLLKTTVPVTTTSALTGAIGMPLNKIDPRATYAMAKVFRRLGYQPAPRGSKNEDGSRSRIWVPPAG